MDLKSPEGEHIMMLRRLVPTINISQIHDALIAAKFTKVPCRQNLKKVVDYLINQENLNKSNERNDENIEYEDSNLFDFTEIGAIDGKNIIKNISTQRSYNNSVFLKTNIPKNYENKNELFFNIKGYKYTLKNCTVGYKVYICSSCKKIFDGKSKNCTSVNDHNDKNLSKPAFEVSKIVLIEGSERIINEGNHNPECKENFLHLEVVNQIMLNVSKQMKCQVLMPYDGYSLLLDKGQKFANDNNIDVIKFLINFPEFECFSVTLSMRKNRTNTFTTDQLDEILYKTKHNQDFIRKSTEKYILCISDYGLQTLIFSDVWIMDGTFKKKSRNHGQLYCIHAWYKGKYICAGFGLLKNRQKTLYSALFRTLKQEIINYHNKYISYTPQNFFKDKVVVIDREQAVISSLRSTFFCDIVICYFHTIQNLQKRLKALGLQQIYSKKNGRYSLRNENSVENTNLFNCIKHIYTLPLFRVDKAKQFWITIKNDLQKFNSQKVSIKKFNYF
uniref:MULE domain-containing protein n=1 Tax=Strongyloides papillosus TaxID=174720 RepID=A0A0N5BU93_STREA